MSTVRESSLNFSIQETPYSLYICIRKSFSKPSEISKVDIEDNTEADKHEETRIKNESDTLRNELKSLQSDNFVLKNDFEEAIDECAEHLQTIKHLELKVTSTGDNCEKLVEELKHVNETLEVMKSEKSALENRLDVAERKLKSSNKVIKEKEKEIDILNKENYTVTSNLVQVQTELSNLISKVNTEMKFEKKTEKKLIKNNLINTAFELECRKCDVKVDSQQKLKSHERIVHTTSISTQSSLIEFSEKS